MWCADRADTGNHLKDVQTFIFIALKVFFLFVKSF